MSIYSPDRPRTYAEIRASHWFNEMRSVPQLAALADWGRRRGRFLIPPASADLGQSLRRGRDDILILRVDGVPQPTSLRIEFLGSQFTRLWPSAAKGQRLFASGIPYIERACFLDYLYVLVNAEPHFRALELQTQDKAITRFERLLLPFGNEGRVTSIVCNFALIAQSNGYPKDILSRGEIVSGLIDYEAA